MTKFGAAWGGFFIVYIALLVAGVTYSDSFRQGIMMFFRLN